LLDRCCVCGNPHRHASVVLRFLFFGVPVWTTVTVSTGPFFFIPPVYCCWRVRGTLTAQPRSPPDTNFSHPQDETFLLLCVGTIPSLIVVCRDFQARGCPPPRQVSVEPFFPTHIGGCDPGRNLEFLAVFSPPLNREFPGLASKSLPSRSDCSHSKVPHPFFLLFIWSLVPIPPTVFSAPPSFRTPQLYIFPLSL